MFCRLRQVSKERANDTPNKSESLGDQISSRAISGLFWFLGARWGEISLRGSETQRNETVRLLWNITTKY